VVHVEKHDAVRFLRIVCRLDFPHTESSPFSSLDWVTLARRRAAATSVNPGLEVMMPASRIRTGSLVAALALLASSAPAAAQAVASKTVATRPSHAAQLKSALRSAAAAQAKHHAMNRSYATSVDQLRLPAMPGMRLEIVMAGRSGWQGRARHQEQPGRSCVIFVGRIEGVEAPRTDEARDMAGEEGVPLCDRMR
jgi:hypothetical protein